MVINLIFINSSSEYSISDIICEKQSNIFLNKTSSICSSFLYFTIYHTSLPDIIEEIELEVLGITKN